MKVINKFLDCNDFKLETFQALKKDIEYLYTTILKKKPHSYGSKHPNQTKIHWSRDWEYPWAITFSEVKAGDKVLDCGCGGSPLLPFLAQYGCIAYGVDPYLFKKFSTLKYYLKVIKTYLNDIKLISSMIFKIKLENKSQIKSEFHQKSKSRNENFPSYLYSALKLIKKHINLILKPKLPRKNNLNRFTKNPNKLGFRIRFYSDSLDNIHFEDNFFDKVFCISVIEHLHEDVAYKGMKEMARVLKKDGLLIITLDNDGPHVNPKLVGKYDVLIKQSGLKLYGSSDFDMPKPEDNPGTYNVLGFILKK
jgi:ubiquinone/menaquinone biosynthesis C-methylase UbiE